MQLLTVKKIVSSRQKTNFSALTNHEMYGDMWGEFSLRSWSMRGAEHTSCQSPIWGFP